MANFKLANLYDNTEESVIEEFSGSVNSNLHVINNVNKKTSSLEWLEMMEDTVRYIDNILRNPNRFIVNEEDIVKIELARKITVDSIKHLSKNTNFIQDIDPKTGDVKPSKILNINKEESFNTYENRFIYSLIKNMIFYIDKKKKTLDGNTYSMKSFKSFEYAGSGCLGKENVSINVNLNAKIDDSDGGENSGLTVGERISKLESKITDLQCSNTYKVIDKLHITLVTSPIKKTNVVLKNVNFQYALKLWDYMQSHYDDESGGNENINEDYDDSSELKSMMDESFMLDYLVLSNLNKSDKESVNKNKITEKLVDNMLEKVVSLNNEIDEETLQRIVSEKYSVIKYKTVVNEKQIEKVYRSHFDKYLDIIKELRI